MEIPAGTWGTTGHSPHAASVLLPRLEKQLTEGSLLLILRVRRNRFRNMKIEDNLGDSYHRMRKLTAPEREKEQQNTNSRLEERQLEQTQRIGN